MRRRKDPLLAAALVLVMPLSALADGKQLFEALYGVDVRRAKATTLTPEDDIALAKKLVGDAKNAVPQEDLLIELCNNAYDLAKADPAGVAIAIEAMEHLAAKVPAQAPAATEKLIDLYHQQYTAADDEQKKPIAAALVAAVDKVALQKLAAGATDEAAAMYELAATVAQATGHPKTQRLLQRVTLLRGRLKTEQRIRQLLAQLNLNPSGPKADQTRLEVIKLYLIDLDQPAAAAPFADGLSDAQLTRFVSLAGGLTQPADDADWYGLARWYYDQIEQADPLAQANVIARARMYYQRFIDVHSEPDLRRAKSVLALRKLDKIKVEVPTVAIAPVSVDPAVPVGPTVDPAVTPAPPDNGNWQSLLERVELDKDTEKGQWERRGKALVVKPDVAARVRIPVLLEGSYRLRVTLLRQDGTSTIGIVLPVGEAAVRLMMSGYGGAASGLGMINGKLASENETTVTPGTLTNGQPHTVIVEVKLQPAETAAIDVQFDGKPYIHWQGPRSALTVQDAWRFKGGNVPGVGAHQATVVFNAIDVDVLSGTLKPLR